MDTDDLRALLAALDRQIEQAENDTVWIDLFERWMAVHQQLCESKDK